MLVHHESLQGGIHLVGNQIVRVAMLLCHARSPLQVVQERFKTFNVGHPFGASIFLEIWGIHLAGNQITRVAMFLCLARSSLLVVQEKLKTFNAGQAFETQPELHNLFTN